MRLWTHPLNDNDLRQCLRIATGATLGFAFNKYFGWNFGVFFTVVPMLLLGMIPVLNGHIARQMIASAVICTLEVGLLAGLFGGHPGIMTIIALLLFLSKFACMARGPLFLFGANCVLNLSIMLHFASYSTTDINDMISCNMAANFLAIGIAYLMHYLIPDVSPRQPPPPPTEPKRSHRFRHETLLGTGVATLSFLVFQTFNLSDSMSAQSTSLLLLFPMNWNGALGYARKRAMGTILAVVFGLSCQILLYDRSNQLILVIPLLWIGTMLFGYLHVKEASGSGVGFGGLTTLGILFGQYLTPTSDLTFNALYRISSILFAIVATLIATYLIHRFLNTIEATKYGH